MVTAVLTMNNITCSSCGVVFAVAASYENERRQDRKTFWCPNGHALRFNGRTKDEEIRELKQTIERRERALNDVREQRDRASRSAQGYKIAASRARGERDRIKTRVAAGVCPCCNRTFQQLARHMASKHPDMKP